MLPMKSSAILKHGKPTTMRERGATLITPSLSLLHQDETVVQVRQDPPLSLLHLDVRNLDSRAALQMHNLARAEQIDTPVSLLRLPNESLLRIRT